MTICSTCTLTKEIPQCVVNLTIGQIDDPNKDVYVFFKNLTTDREQRFTAASNAFGLVIVNISTPANFFSPGFQYEMWVTNQGSNATERLPIFIAGGLFTCFLIKISPIFENPPVTYQEITLQLDGEFTRVEPIQVYDGRVALLDDVSHTVRAWENTGTLNPLGEGVQLSVNERPTKTNNIITFDGVQDNLRIADFPYERSHFHFMAMAKLDSTANASFPVLMGHYKFGDSLAWIAYYDNSNGAQYFCVNETDILGRGRAILDLDARDVWVLTELIWNEGEIEIFANGLRHEQEAFANDPIAFMQDSTQPQLIGCTLNNLNQESDHFKGDIRKIKIFNSPLSAIQRHEEILSMIGEV